MTIKQTEIPEAHAVVSGAAPAGHVLQPIGRFVAQFAAMCASMCIGGSILLFAFFGGAGLMGFSDLDQRSPELPLLVVTLGMAAGMSAWMWLRHHPARHTVEMSGVTIVVGILFAGAYWIGILSESSLPGWQRAMTVLCGPQCLVMLLVMLFHLDHYTGKMQHPAHAA